jgi:hypothetical protein
LPRIGSTICHASSITRLHLEADHDLGLDLKAQPVDVRVLRGKQLPGGRFSRDLCGNRDVLFSAIHMWSTFLDLLFML